MTRMLCGAFAFLAGVALIASPAVSQPPAGKDFKGKDGKGGQGGMPKFELGQIMPPQLEAELKLTVDQQKELEAIKADVKAKLDKLLTADQKKAAENFRPRFGPGGPGGPGGFPGQPGQPGQPGAKGAPPEKNGTQ